MRQALVERNQLKTTRLREGRQVGTSPVPLKVRRLNSIRHVWITSKDVVLLPGLVHCQGMNSENLLVACEAEEALLGQSAEEADLYGQGIEPYFGGGMVNVRIKCQSQPDVNVGEKHRVRPKFPQSVRRSN